MTEAAGKTEGPVDAVAVCLCGLCSRITRRATCLWQTAGNRDAALRRRYGVRPTAADQMVRRLPIARTGDQGASAIITRSFASKPRQRHLPIRMLASLKHCPDVKPTPDPRAGLSPSSGTSNCSLVALGMFLTAHLNRAKPAKRVLTDVDAAKWGGLGYRFHI
ncbi:MAG TPA: hypothetical protein VGC09_07160 [Rhodopila sp.]